MRKLYLILSAASLGGAPMVAAQAPAPGPTPMGGPQKDREECVTNNGKTECRVYRFKRDSTMIKRAALGVQVQTTGTKRDTLGVFIAGVTPDGPAEKSGVIEGERIASINGVDLRVPAADVEDSYTAGLAAHRLTREMQKVAPGARVSLRVYSGGRFRDVQVTTVRSSELKGMRHEMGMMGFPGMPNVRIMRQQLDGAGMNFMRAPAAPGVVKVRVRPKTPGSPGDVDVEIDEDVVIEKAPSPAVAPKPAKVSGQIIGSM